MHYDLIGVAHCERRTQEGSEPRNERRVESGCQKEETHEDDLFERTHGLLEAATVDE